MTERMRNALALSLATLLMAAPGVAAAGEPDRPDLTQWPCESCPDVLGWRGWVGVDADLAAGTTEWSSRATGYATEGLHPALDLDLLRLDADGTRATVVARGLGQEFGRLAVDIGRFDRYAAGFDWWRTRWVTADHPETPFLGVGSDTLTLPAGWVRGGTTAGMTQLGNALHPVEMDLQRERFGAHGTWFARNGWTTSLAARHETKHGVDAIGGSFLTRTSLLPEPVDQVTESLDATAAYQGQGWDVAVHYLLSTFDSDATSLAWDNPYLGLHPTADVGQLALAPDNEFQQVAADARWRLARGWRFEGGLALGLGTQDATLLPATANPGLATALPRATADAEATTQTAYARATLPFDGFTIRSELRYDAREVDTPVDLWTQVVTDTFVGGVEANPNYATRRTRLKVEGDWAIGSVRFAARGQSLVTERDGQAVDRTQDDRMSLEARGWVLGTLDWSLEIGRDVRSASGYASPAGENPLMRMWPYADMQADRFAIALGATPIDALTLGLRLEQRDETYTDSLLGLAERKDTGVAFDAGWAITEQVSMTGWYSRQTLDTDQAGSSAFAAPDWIGTSADATEAMGLTLLAPWVTDKLGLRAEFNLTEATGLVTIDQGVTSPFPETLSRLRQFLLAADYRLDERITLRAGLRLERLEVADWALLGVAPGTVNALLWSGEDQPGYELEVLELGVRIGL